MERDELVSTLKDAAVVALHKAILRDGQVVLTAEDFANAELAELNGQYVRVSMGTGGDVVLTHGQRDKERDDA